MTSSQGGKGQDKSDSRGTCRGAPLRFDEQDAGKRRFVIGRHSRGQESHYDLMLETGERLRTFRMNAGPGEIGSEEVELEQIADHDKKFLKYEGPVNGGEGFFERVEQGEFKMTEESEYSDRIFFEGEQLKGEFVLKKSQFCGWTLKRA